MSLRRFRTCARMTRLILNVKQIRLISRSEEPVRIHVEVTNEGPITAGDLICPPEVEVVNRTSIC